MFELVLFNFFQTSDIDERTTRASASTSGAAAEQARVMVEAAQGAEQSRARKSQWKEKGRCRT